jgi:hypothetical protein
VAEDHPRLVLPFLEMENPRIVPFVETRAVLKEV